MSAPTFTQPVRSAQVNALTYTARGRKIAVLVVALAFVMDLMDSTILTIALPTIQRHMHASLVAVNWMAAAYTLTFAVLLVAGGRMGGIFGYRRLFRVGVTAFMVIVHYVQTLQFRSSSGRSQTAVREVWVSGQQRHLIITGNDHKQGTAEITFNGSAVQSYHSPRGTIYTYRVSARLLARGCGSIGILLGECVRSDQINPLTALRRLYESGRLHAAGQATLRGRRVDLITGSAQVGRLRALVDPHTFIPIEIQLV